MSVKRINTYLTVYDPASGPEVVTVPMGMGHPAVAAHLRADEDLDEDGDVVGLEVHVAWAGVTDTDKVAELLRELASALENASLVVELDPRDFEKEEN